MSGKQPNDEGHSDARKSEQQITPEQWNAMPIKDATPEQQRNAAKTIKKALKAGLPVVTEDQLGYLDGSPVVLDGKEVSVRTVTQRNRRARTVLVGGKAVTAEQYARLCAVMKENDADLEGLLNG